MAARKRLRKLFPLAALVPGLLLLPDCRPGAPPAVTDPVEQRLAVMSPREMAALLVAPPLGRAFSSRDDQLRAELATGAAAAVLVRAADLRPGLPPADSVVPASLRPLLLVADLEEQPADTLSGVALPPLHLLAAVASEQEMRDLGARSAASLLPLGVRLGLVSLPPIAGGEPMPAAGRDRGRIAAGVAAFIEGARQGGLPVAPRVLRPGDSARVPLRWDRARLEAIELPELAALVAAQPGGLVVGGSRLESITGDTLPLPFSPAGVEGLLRRDAGYEGLVLADVAPGSGARGARPLESVAVAAVAAGVDLLLGAERPAAVVDALVAAVQQGRLPRRRLEQAAARVLRMRRATMQADSARAASPAASPPAGGIDSSPAVRWARAIARAPDRRTADSIFFAAQEAFSEGEVAADGGRRQWPPAPEVRVAAPDSVGMRTEVVQQIDRVMRQGLQDSVFSAAAVAVGRRGGLVMLRGYGSMGRLGGGGAVDGRRTLFDLASLTKVVGTTSAVALLVDEGKMSLDDRVEEYFPSFDGGAKDAVRIRHLLTHTSGLPSGLWLFGSAGSPGEAIRQVLRQDLLRDPGERMEYSDLGMILLAAAAEQAAGMPLDRYLALRLFAPLGMESTMYLPPAALRDSIVPTAEENEREFALHGVVHDANAFRLGGVAGHAGLFSTASDLAVFAQTMLNGGAYGSVRVLSPDVVQLFTRRQPGAEQRALGWDTPSRVSSAGAWFSARSFGHTGYTGTSLWIDPTTDLFVVLLTNRTYTRASGGEILRLRAAVHDAAARAAGVTRRR